MLITNGSITLSKETKAKEFDRFNGPICCSYNAIVKINFETTIKKDIQTQIIEIKIKMTSNGYEYIF